MAIIKLGQQFYVASFVTFGPNKGIENHGKIPECVASFEGWISVLFLDRTFLGEMSYAIEFLAQFWIEETIKSY